MKILLVNFGAFGDILNSTPIAKHYKLFFPECHITWMTRKKYASSVQNNPFINEILTPKEEHLQIENAASYNVHMTFLLMEEIKKLKNKYDKIFFVAPYTWTLTNNEFNVDKHSLLNIIKTKLTDIKEFVCEFIPVVSLTDEEKQEAKNFYNFLKGNKKILVEYENYSNQSPFNKEYVEKLCEQIQEKNYDLIFSGKQEPEYVKELREKYKVNFYNYSGSFMSNAELYNLCDIFIGCSSGLSCLTHSDYCDITKHRIEVVKDNHWSTADWKHMKNKKICFDYQSYEEEIKNILYE